MSGGSWRAAGGGNSVPSGYGPQYRDGLIEDAINSKISNGAFSARLKSYREELVYPEMTGCAEAVWLTQNLLLGTKQDIDDIANAIIKIMRTVASWRKAL